MASDPLLGFGSGRADLYEESQSCRSPAHVSPGLLGDARIDWGFWGLCTSAQRVVIRTRTLSDMTLSSIKLAASAVWITSAILIGLVAGVTSSGAIMTLAALGGLPPLALLLLWNDPAKTMSESIREGLR